MDRAERSVAGTKQSETSRAGERRENNKVRLRSQAEVKRMSASYISWRPFGNREMFFGQPGAFVASAALPGNAGVLEPRVVARRRRGCLIHKLSFIVCSCTKTSRLDESTKGWRTMLYACDVNVQ